jgi:hypothetical protein
MASGSGGEYECGPEFWEEQDPKFKGGFPVLHKRDFRSMREVRSYDLTNRCCGQYVHTMSVV